MRSPASCKTECVGRSTNSIFLNTSLYSSAGRPSNIRLRTWFPVPSPSLPTFVVDTRRETFGVAIDAAPWRSDERCLISQGAVDCRDGYGRMLMRLLDRTRIERI